MRLRGLLYGCPAAPPLSTSLQPRALPAPVRGGPALGWDVRVEEYPGPTGPTGSPWGPALVLRCQTCGRPVTTVAPGDVLGVIVGLVAAHQRDHAPIGDAS